MENINTGAVSYIDGPEGLPAFSIKHSANLRSPSRLVVPDKLGKNENLSCLQVIVTTCVPLDEFAITAIIKTDKPPHGFLFSIVNSLETVIQLGLKVAPTPNSNINISLVYNDHATVSPSESIISFTLPYEQKHWIKFDIQVMNEKISVYHNCIKTNEFNFTREPRELSFESSSTFYLAQAGNMKHKFEVSRDTIFVSAFQALVIHCKNAFSTHQHVVAAYIYPAKQNNFHSA